MRANVTELARAQGLRDDFESLQRLRRGKGVTEPSDLCTLSEYIKVSVLGISRDSESELAQGLVTLKDLVDQSPLRERELLRLCFNFDGECGNLQWSDRVEDFGRGHGRSSRSVRDQADLAILQLLMRTRPAAEREPAPGSEPEVSSGMRHSKSPAMSFFNEDYVRHSPQLIASWEVAESVDICGFGHNRMAVTFSAEIARIVRGGGRIRVLLQDPEGRAVLDANRRSSTPKASDNAVRHQHRSGIATFHAICAAANSPSESLQLRAYDIMPPFTGYFFNAESDDAHAYIWFWSWRQPSAWRPGFRLSRIQDSLWYQRFWDQFDAIWNDEDVAVPLLPEEYELDD